MNQNRKNITTRNLRVIGRLDVKGPNLVKGVQLEGLRVLGKPERFAKHYYEQGADELLYVDAVASLYGRNSLLEIVESTAKETFIPLSVGGGIRSIEDIRCALQAGADKVAINTAAVSRPQFITEASRRFGSSTIVISIEAIRHDSGKYEVYTDNGREKTGLDAFDWAKQVAELGAGEILLTAIHREGTGKGFDVELTEKVCNSVNVPVIASGGAGTIDHITEIATQTEVSAVALASILHYDAVRNDPGQDEFAEQINLSALRDPKGFKPVEDASLAQIKQQLLSQGVACRA